MGPEHPSDITRVFCDFLSETVATHRSLERTSPTSLPPFWKTPEPHDRQIYPLYGPVEMNHYEIADAISQTLGIPVRYEPLEVATFAEGLKARDSSSHLVQHLSNVAVDYQNGIFAGTNNLVEGSSATGRR